MTFAELPPEGKIVGLHCWVRLTWKGEAPQVPHMVSGMDGTLWLGNVNYRDKTFIVEEKHGVYGDRSEATNTVHGPFKPEDVQPVKKAKAA